MIYYEVSLDVEPALVDKIKRYMREKHIPEIYDTGCFVHIHFDQSSPTRFRTCYIAKSQADLDRYINEHTQSFREDFGRHFPSGATPSREIWSELERWGG